MAERFFADQPLSLGDFRLLGAEAHHLAHVRRIGAGDRVVLFNGDGRQYPAEVLETSKREVLLRIDNVEEPRRECPGTLHIGSALPKGDRADFLIEKLTELGATDFTPLIMARSIVQPKPQIVEKFRRAVIEASKQCGRNTLLRVHPPQKFLNWAAGLQVEHKWLLHPGGRSLERAPASIAAAIGPEGGFTEEERIGAEENGFSTISLGPRILRMETAALAITAMFGLSVGNQ